MALPTDLTYGYIVGRLLLAIGDTAGDPDRLPDGVAPTGTVKFTPVQTEIFTAQPATSVFPQVVTCTVDTDGYLLDPTAMQGVWLVAGQYKVSFAFPNVTADSFTITVTAAMTPENPGDLTLLAPIPSSPAVVFVVNQQVYNDAVAARDAAIAAAAAAAASAAEAAQAVGVVTFATANTSDSHAGWWARIATASIPGQFADAGVVVDLLSQSDGDTYAAHEVLRARVKWQNAGGTDPLVEFVLEQSHTLTSADLAYKIVSNAPTAAPIIVDFYIRVGVSFRSYFASVRLAAPINLWTFHAGEALIQTLPTGTASGMTAIVAPDTTWAQPAIRSIDNFDLNFVTNPGRYHGSGLGNAPDISPWFVDVQAFGGHTYQTLMNDGNSGATYQRFNAGGNWSGWIAIADSAGAFVGEIRAGRLAGVNQDFSQSDLNGLQTAGWYKGYGFTNSPLGGTGWFYVDVRVAGAGGYVYQRATAFTDQTGSTFERQLVNGTWTAWTQIADTAGAVDPTARAAAAVKPVTSVAGKTGAVTLAKADVGLGSVDNTADAAKPISTAQAAVNAAKADLVGGVVPTAQIPALALTATLVVASQAAMLALTTAQVQPGDLAVRTDGAGTFILTATDPSVLGNWTRLNAPTDAVVSVNSQVGTVVLAKADVGLGSVDNTADTAKPVSTAQAAALGLKAPLASPTFTGTVAGVTAAMVGAVPTTGGISKLVQITQAAYTALATKDGATLYVVVG